jgi:FAD/FMN-containing dehydrogenase
VVIDMQQLRISSLRSRHRSPILSLAARLRGEVLVPGNSGYDEARAIVNAAIDRRPRAIVRPAGTADVQAAVEFAAANGLPLSVRGGGHAVSGAAIADGGLTIDMRPLKRIRIDPERRLARAETGLTWAEFNAEAQKAGLTVPSGKFASIGLGGSTLGGGIGWLVRKHGLTIDHVRAAEIVTADGRALTVNADEHPDLYWAIRGGGGNFGVVTAIEFDLFPVATVYGGLVAYPLPLAGRALRVFREFIATAPEELTAVAAFWTAPDGSRLIVFGAAYAGPATAGERALRPLSAFANPIFSTFDERPYGAFLRMFEEDGKPGGMGLRIRAGFVREIGDGLIEALIDGFAAAPPSAHAVVILNHLGGAMARVAPDATAFPHRGETLALEAIGGWHGPDQAASTDQWVLDLWQAARPHATGAAPVGFLDAEGPARVRAAYGANWDRLVAVKRRYDPANLFRFNQNIAPN